MGYFSLSSSLAMALAPAVALYLLNVSNFRNVAILAGGLGIFALILSFSMKHSIFSKEYSSSQCTHCFTFIQSYLNFSSEIFV
ncbi:hypothetical protein [Clostridium estertheticum]|uniref:hypothetical protein n=1 Tax=Clostridium estertheticum TaxID=238834 RepID=UPI0035C7EC11